MDGKLLIVASIISG